MKTVPELRLAQLKALHWEKVASEQGLLLVQGQLQAAQKQLEEMMRLREGLMKREESLKALMLSEGIDIDKKVVNLETGEIFDQPKPAAQGG